MTSKQFWRLVKRTVKKGIITAVKDAQGKLATDRPSIEEIVLEDQAKIFSGQQSEIFSHRGEQLIKEMYLKQRCMVRAVIEKMKELQELIMLQ